MFRYKIKILYDKDSGLYVAHVLNSRDYIFAGGKTEDEAFIKILDCLELVSGGEEWLAREV